MKPPIVLEPVRVVRRVVQADATGDRLANLRGKPLCKSADVVRDAGPARTCQPQPEDRGRKRFGDQDPLQMQLSQDPLRHRRPGEAGGVVKDCQKKVSVPAIRSAEGDVVV